MYLDDNYVCPDVTVTGKITQYSDRRVYLSKCIVSMALLMHLASLVELARWFLSLWSVPLFRT